MITTLDIVTNEIIDNCAEQIIIHKHDYYHELFDRQSTKQKQLLLGLIHTGANIFSAQFTKKYRLSTPSTTQKSVTLMDSGIIDKTGNNYFITDPFFKRFLEDMSYK